MYVQLLVTFSTNISSVDSAGSQIFHDCVANYRRTAGKRLRSGHNCSIFVGRASCMCDCALTLSYGPTFSTNISSVDSARSQIFHDCVANYRRTAGERLRSGHNCSIFVGRASRMCDCALTLSYGPTKRRAARCAAPKKNQ